MSGTGCVTTSLMVALLLWIPGYGQENQCFQEEHNDICEDQYQSCTAWAEEGYCKNTTQWMKSNCPDACGHCDSFGVEDFNMAVFKEVSLNSPGSVFMSPYSIWSAFVLTYFGSEGTTKEQLQAALGVRGKSDTYTKWRFIDFFIEKPHQQNGAIFRSLNKAYFDQNVPLKICISKLIYNLEEVNFSNKMATADIINEEVRRTTEGMIAKLINPRDLLTVNFLLLNAVYFKGKWENPFNSIETETTDFYNEQNREIGKVEMMIGESRYVQHVKYDPLGADIAEIPYDNSSISMILIKPHEGLATIDSILYNLTSAILQDAMNQMVNKTVRLGIPKFRMETRIEEDLLKAMNALGVKEIFSGHANLSGFSNIPLKVNKVIHEAVIDVTEEGTKAAAATAVFTTRFGGRPYEMVMNKPFIFLIHDKSAKVTLFAGTFRHPNDAQSFPTVVKGHLH